MKTLIIQGGYRIGDASHLIPLLNKFKNDGHEITWVTGDYEQDAAKFIAGVMDINLIVLPEYRKPGDITDRERFIEQVIPTDGAKKTLLDLNQFDNIITDVRVSFEIAYQFPKYLGNYPELTYLKMPQPSRKDKCVCVQPDSISKQPFYVV